ncbi:alpha/beta fold hydrolase [Salibaculum griseiflavum]|uniref:Alpha/beta hydrolase n=1 Tax=Salibaculum griseiflavum TaxID=1914409 RepID=A0A2V1P7Y9_9RHOB|nr:alpha/beta hydrolase [Salibaculum griseiflavum]PWG18446.1 alpha/beta hydrolase [Salibaculum griseiflavum]
MGWVILTVLVAVIATLPQQAEARRVPAEQMRDAAPGRFAKLSQGVTHYQWLGPVRGPVLVAVHGLTTPSPVFYAIARGLARLGYRVLVYDLYGRGYSDAPEGPQDREFFMRQLRDLLAHQELEDDLTLLGYSMGGAIATAFAAAHPGRMKRLILLAPAGMRLREDRLTEFCRVTPFIGDWVHAVIAQRRERRMLHRQLGQNFDVKGIIELQLSEYSGRGFLRSVLSSRRHMLDEVQEDEHRLLGREGVPVVGIWGEKDQVIPLSSLGMLTQWNRSVRQEVVQGAGHQMPYTHSDEVVGVLADILREVS